MSLEVEELGTFFLPRPDEGEEPSLYFKLRQQWYAIDGDKLILPIAAVEKNGTNINQSKGLLTQYGGSELLLQMATSDQDMKAGSGWVLHYRDSYGFIIEPAALDDS